MSQAVGRSAGRAVGLLAAVLTALTADRLPAQVPACPARADPAAQAGWRAYRDGVLARATEQFARADSLCPAHVAAGVGLGFVRLREGRWRDAEGAFRQALGRDRTLADAWYGLGLARHRLGRRDAAVAAWRRALRLAPHYRDAADQLLALGLDSGLSVPPPATPAEPRVAARATGDAFEVRLDGSWRPFYVRGINLGAARPGRFPAEFPTDDSTYDHWVRLIGDLNANVIRVYTILPPAFYRALRRWNDARPDRPLWLVHGVWAEPPPAGDYDHAEWKEAFRAEARRVVDVLHGRAAIPARAGHAFGRYDVDVSDRTLAYIIGREWEPSTIRAYNARRRERSRYAGRFLAVDRGTAADVWMAEQCDYLLMYEWETYHAARPVAFTNWPTLDPLRHPSEPTAEEERAIRRRLGLSTRTRLKEYDNDGESLDAMLVRATAANPAGYFAAYHAYPYYPDFIGLDPAYAGPSRYLAYLRDLKRHHAGRPLLIAEYGVPSSRGVAHLDADGRHHGGHDERGMAETDVRLTREIRDAGLAGGILFSWLDEWFKHNWIVYDVSAPGERTPLWHNVMNAEQHYGLLGQYAGHAGRPEPGGPEAAWRALPELARAGGVGLRAGVDPAYVYLALEAPSRPSSIRWVVGIDVHRPDRGEFRLPGRADTSEIGLEFVLHLRDTSDAELRVVPWYNPYVGPRPGMPVTGLDAFYNDRTTVDRRSAAGRFDSLFVATNRFRVSRDGRSFPARGVNRGRLRYGRAREFTLADWYVDDEARLVEIRIPWALLNVADPSSRRVLHRVTARGPFPVVATDGFRFVVRGTDRASGVVAADLGPTSTFAWTCWDEPVWHERLKPAYYAMQRLWASW